MAKVILDNLCKEYPLGRGQVKRAVDEVSLSIGDREFVVFVGPSGSGKSTILRMIAGLEDASCGTIAIDGRQVNRVPPKKRGIAMVFQNAALYPHRTVYENMTLGLEYQKCSKERMDQLVHEAARSLGIENVLHLKPNALTRGQLQCAAVGRAIVHKPKVFLFDEPLSNLDASMRVGMRTEISKLHARLSATMIYVTHDQVEAMTMGDRIAVMNEGKLMQVADPLTIYNHPENMFVGGFIGSPPMNFIHGTVEPDSGSLYFIEKNTLGIPIRLRLPEILAGKAAARLGKPLVLGIRCEDVSDLLVIANPHPDYIVEARLEVSEPLGSLTFLYLDTGGHSLIARAVGAVRYEINTDLKVYFNLDKAHLFDAKTERILK